MKEPFRRIALLSLAFAFVANAAAAGDARGMIQAVHRTVLSSQLSGRVVALPKRPGEAFTAGESLARIDCTLYEAERDKVASRLAQARRKRDNKQRLAELDSVGKLAVDLAELAVREARAELEIARLNVERCDVEAPFDGRVVKLHASEHQSVKAQQKLLEIVGRRLEARIIVPAAWLDWLDPGAALTLVVEETGTQVEGKVARIGAAVDPVSHTVPVWARLKSTGKGLRPGMSGAARFPGRPGDGQ